jgi:uncharacterized membrane protein
MHKGRLEAFSDAVVAIIMTIMVLELKVPHGERWSDLRSVVPVFLSYVLSFVILGIYWNNHHHMLQVIRKVNGPTLWANLHLLFWLSLIPFTTAWMGENHFAAAPVALYGMVLLLSGLAYTVLVRVLLAHHGRESLLAIVAGKDRKGFVSSVLYAIGVAVAFAVPMLALGIYWLVALLWLIPDPRLERAFEQAATER